MSFFEELRRRNVVRVGIAYVVVAWLVLQVADIVFEAIGTPDWVMQTLLVVLAIGALLALFFAWAFELTPEGLKREKDVDRSSSIAPKTGRKLDFAIIGLLVLALGYFVWESRFRDDTSTSADSTPTQAAAGREEEDPTPSTGPAVETTGIVVLPFVNMSADADQEYFSDGLSEEILNALAQIEDLRVISRTSAFAFKGKDMSIPEIAEQLQVSHVLEGSVRSAGDQVRITAQLIEVSTDSHLWSEAYSRSLENVFEVQEEISLAIADQLQLRLADDGGRSLAPTRNPEAYRLFLRGRHHYQVRGTEDMQLALQLLKEAVSLDPTYADAWANLAATQMVAGFMSETGYEPLYQASSEAAERALAVDPSNGLAHAVKGLLAFRQFDYELAIAQLDLAIELNPNESNSFLWKGIVLHMLGYVDAAVDVMQQAEAFDPAFANLQNWLAGAHLATGNLEAVVRHRDQALAVVPNFQFNNDSDLMRVDGKPGTEEAVIRSLWNGRPDAGPMVNAYLAALDDPAEIAASVPVIQAYAGGGWDDPRFPWLYRLGAVPEALDAWREEANSGRAMRAANSLTIIWSATDRANLSHEAMAPFFEEFGMADYWRTHGDPDFCRRVGDEFECGDS